MEREKFTELNFTNGFILAKVMLNKRLCKQLLELISGVKIKKIDYPDLQKTINPS